MYVNPMESDIACYKKVFCLMMSHSQDYSDNIQGLLLSV